MTTAASAASADSATSRHKSSGDASGKGQNNPKSPTSGLVGKF